MHFSGRRLFVEVNEAMILNPSEKNDDSNCSWVQNRLFTHGEPLFYN